MRAVAGTRDARSDAVVQDAQQQRPPLPIGEVEAWRREHTIELLVLLFLIVPSIVIALFAAHGGERPSFTVVAFATIFNDLALVALVLFFLWRNGESITRIGWSFRHAPREVLVGLVLFPPVSVAAVLLESLLKSIGLSAPAHPPPDLMPGSGLGQMVLALSLVFVVAAAEETIFRGYVIARLRETTHHTWLAVVLSGIIFALGHGYEGLAGVVTVGALGIAFALVFLWRKSLVAPITMHFCQDFLSIVLAPLLAHRA